MKNSIEQLKPKLENAYKIAIFGHEYIDGDSLGACLALGKILEKIGKEVDYFTPISPSPVFDFLQGTEKFSTEFSEKDYDILIFCDTSDPNTQLNSFRYKHRKNFQQKEKIIIDHHISNIEYGDFQILNSEEASTCDIIYDIIEINRPELRDENIANLTLLGIITDTGNFTLPNATAETLRKAAKLIEKGAQKNEIINNIFKNNSLKSINFIATLLKRTSRKDNIIYTYFTDDEIEKLGIDLEMAKSVMHTVTTIKEGEIFVLLRKDKDKLKGSIRSEKGYAKIIAEQLFGGGGHLAAAGFKIKCNGKSYASFRNQVNHIIEEIHKFMSGKQPNK